MADVIYVAVILGLFAVAALFVVACDKIIGPDDVALAEEGPDVMDTERAAERVVA